MAYIYIEAADALFLVGRGYVRLLLTHVDEVGGRECVYSWGGIEDMTVEIWRATAPSVRK